jgi:LmbE family N-acetylglucosaminyl deacetylase
MAGQHKYLWICEIGEMRTSMTRWLRALIGMMALVLPLRAAAQQVQAAKGPDDRFKTDILVVVAHPDDEAAVTPYLARAIYDLHKRVAVVYGTRGGSGANDYARETGPALADVREQEAREACARLGITNVWFLDGKDTASQNVLNSLANWGHGKNLEELVRIVRITRPEVMLAWLPSIFIGENHGDHQAAGVLATEAFDMADDPAAFPSQVAGATKRLEPYLENLTPWQPKKLYFFSDASDQKQFVGTGPAYSVKEISPAQKKPYWRIALNAAMPHLTQFPEEIQKLSKMSDAQLEQMMNNPNAAFWHDPMTLIFGKSVTIGKPNDDVFANPNVVRQTCTQSGDLRRALFVANSHFEAAILGGPWAFYRSFYWRHCLTKLPAAKIPEIAVQAGSTVVIPVEFVRGAAMPWTVTIKATVPEGWKTLSGDGTFSLPSEEITFLSVEVQTPNLSAEDAQKTSPQEVHVRVTSENTSDEVTLRVLLRKNALPQ